MFFLKILKKAFANLLNKNWANLTLKRCKVDNLGDDNLEH